MLGIKPNGDGFNHGLRWRCLNIALGLTVAPTDAATNRAHNQRTDLRDTAHENREKNSSRRVASRFARIAKQSVVENPCSQTGQ
jgi:hypothetical protein